MSTLPVVKWWESAEYIAAEKALERAAWATVCKVQTGDMAGAKEQADAAMSAHEELRRLTPA